MGRQTAIVATEEDERSLVAFMRADADIRILRRGAQTPEGLWFAELPPYDRFHTQFYLWNAAFAWEPVIESVQGGVVVRDIATAPVIELGRTNVEWLFRPDNTLLVAGSRLYWSKHHMAARLKYDEAEFERWYDGVIRWVRKHGQRVPAIAGSPYLLPDAWRRWQERQPAEPSAAADPGRM